MKEFSIQRLWKHNLLAGEFAGRIMQAETSNQKMKSQAVVAGLLHDIGKLVLIVNCPDQYRKILSLAGSQIIPHWEAEREILKTTHAELGAYLLGLWGLPGPVVEAVAYHPFPSHCSNKGLSPLTAVHVANVLEHREAPGQKLSCNARIDEIYLDDIGLLDRLKEWEKIVGGKTSKT